MLGVRRQMPPGGTEGARDVGGQRVPIGARLWFALLCVGGCFVLAVLLGIEQRLGTSISVAKLRWQWPWALLACPFMAALAWWVHRREMHGSPAMRFSRVPLLRKMPVGLRVMARAWIFAGVVWSLLTLAAALGGLQSVHARQPTEVQGIDIVLTMDVSFSMQASDIEPNRFVGMQTVVDRFITRRPNDRIGAVIFGREAFTLMPATIDHEALRSVIAGLQLGAIDGQGTAIGNAVGTALNRLRVSKAETRVVILLTDGESNSGNISPDEAARLASALGVRVYTVLMGVSGEAKVQRGFDLFGRPVWDTGDFPVNPELLRAMAEKTGAAAYTAGNLRELEESFYEILNALETSKIEDPGKVYGELYPAFLWPALWVLFVVGMVDMLWVRRWP